MPYSRSILSAEDDADDRLLIRAGLDRVGLGIPIRFVATGGELLDRLRTLPESGERWPRLVLLDLNMPKMNGLEALKALKGDPLLRWLPVTVLTTSNDRAHCEHCYTLGANAFVVKPHTVSELCLTMSTLVRFWYDVVRVPEGPVSAA